MNDLRAAAQQALEALKMHVPQYLRDRGYPPITALKDALAEPVEPVAHKHEWFSTGAMKPGQMRCIHCGVWNHEIPPQRPAEPVQEPVAWRFEARHIDSAWAAAVSLKHPGPEGKYMRNVVPLYTAPPQRKPLSEEEKRALADKFLFYQPESYEVSGVFDLISAVERAHGIGGEE